jgi:hypothetical protein
MLVVVAGSPLPCDGLACEVSDLRALDGAGGLEMEESMRELGRTSWRDECRDTLVSGGVGQRENRKWLDGWLVGGIEIDVKHSRRADVVPSPTNSPITIHFTVCNNQSLKEAW